jgi:HD superfamily phosphodiesterase
MGKNIVIVDLTMSVEDLRLVCDDLNILLETILKNKEMGFHKIWVSIEGKVSRQLIAYTLLGSKKIEIVENVMNSYEIVKPKRESESIEEYLDIDTILDKISANGIGSLSKKELDFLKQNS